MSRYEDGLRDGMKEAFLAGTDNNTDREPTSGVARAQRETKNTAAGKVIIRRRNRKLEAGQRPPGPTTPRTPGELGDDTRQ